MKSLKSQKTLPKSNSPPKFKRSETKYEPLPQYLSIDSSVSQKDAFNRSKTSHKITPFKLENSVSEVENVINPQPIHETNQKQSRVNLFEKQKPVTIGKNYLKESRDTKKSPSKMTSNLHSNITKSPVSRPLEFKIPSHSKEMRDDVSARMSVAKSTSSFRSNKNLIYNPQTGLQNMDLHKDLTKFSISS